MVMGRRGRVHGGYGKFVEKDLCLVESCLPVSFFIRELLRISLFSCSTPVGQTTGHLYHTMMNSIEWRDILRV